MDPNLYEDDTLIESTIPDDKLLVDQADENHSNAEYEYYDHRSSIFLYKIQIITGFISFLASLIMAISIQRSITRSRSTPYRRLVYGLCLSDIVQSLSLISGPFATPTGTPGGIWSKGTIASCNLNGFMLCAGYTAVTMYVLSLSVYYICRLHRKMSNERFRIKLERFIHRFIFLWHLVVNTALVLSGNFNAKLGGALCFVTEYPARCDMAPEINGQCQRGRHAKLLLTIFLFVPWCVCLVGIVYCIIRLVQHAFVLSRVSLWHGKRSIMQTDDTMTCTGEESHPNSGSWSSTTSRSDVNREKSVVESSGDRLVKLSLLYKREMTTQAISFIGVFFFVYLMPNVRYVYYVRKIPFPFELMALYSFCFPLGGLLNILVHTRPHIAELRRRRKRLGLQTSWIQAFVRVLLSGGDILDLKDDLKLEEEQHNDQNPREEGDSYYEDDFESHAKEERSSQISPLSIQIGFCSEENYSMMQSGKIGKERNAGNHLYDNPDDIRYSHGPNEIHSAPSISKSSDLLFPIQRLVAREEDDFVMKFKSRVQGETPW